MLLKQTALPQPWLFWQGGPKPAASVPYRWAWWHPTNPGCDLNSPSGSLIFRASLGSLGEFSKSGACQGCVQWEQAASLPGAAPVPAAHLCTGSLRSAALRGCRARISSVLARQETAAGLCALTSRAAARRGRRTVPPPANPSILTSGRASGAPGAWHSRQGTAVWHWHRLA